MMDSLEEKINAIFHSYSKEINDCKNKEELEKYKKKYILLIVSFL